MAFGFSGSDMEVARLRKAQAESVMPQIGPLLDAWHLAPSDFRSLMREHCPELGQHLDNISAAMEFTKAEC